jgi:hypothetical protein
MGKHDFLAEQSEEDRTTLNVVHLHTYSVTLIAHGALSTAARFGNEPV